MIEFSHIFGVNVNALAFLRMCSYAPDSGPFTRYGTRPDKYNNTSSIKTLVLQPKFMERGTEKRGKEKSQKKSGKV